MAAILIWSGVFPHVEGSQPWILVVTLLLLAGVIIHDRRERAAEESEQRTEPAENGSDTGSSDKTTRRRHRRISRRERRRLLDPSYVIRVEDVCMEFHVATSNASGLKEYLIRKVRNQLSYRRLMALDHVSFSIKKGEVVGIIGTNGSGKSTLLKIIFGALKPTSGRVDVDFAKAQLLTLGTGFDMELTGRENVFLNGSIIGLSREFLEEHYQEIVDFAELEGFMEEKVKNYSSGMMSRLAFAIATAGKAAEILILDEVLSVGDVFFQQKSLARVEEMIHSGSTVLIVSHGMQSVIDYCTRAIWIEKGKLIMDGKPEEVCAAYEGHNRGETVA